MRFLSLFNRAVNRIRSKDQDDGNEVTSAIETSDTKRFPLWIFGSSLGCLGFAVAASFMLIIAVLIYLNIIDISSLSSNGNGSGNCISFQADCDKKAAEQVAKILKNETGGCDLFIVLTTASIILNNAGGTSYEDIYALTSNNYSGYDTYKNNSFETEVPDSLKGKLLYAAEVVLSGKYNLPKNLHYQTAGTGFTIWTSIDSSDCPPYGVNFGTDDKELADTDIFGNKLDSNAYSDISKSVEYYKKLAKNLELSDYSGYTADKVCANFAPADLTCKTVSLSGYGTMSLDEYVSGVIAGEVPGYLDDGLNTYKSVAIAARSYFIASVEGGHPYTSDDGNGNCTLNTNGPTFQNYSSNISNDTTTAANETSGIVLLKDNNVYRSEYDALCIDHEDKTNYYLCQGGENEKNMVLPIDWIVNKTSAAYVAETRLWAHGRGMSQNGAWYLALEKGWTFDKILNYFYGDEGASVSAGGGASAPTKCTNGSSGNFTPAEDYVLGNGGFTELTKTLSTSEIEKINDYIIKEVDKAGYGTSGAVAAAGQALIFGLHDMGYYLPYWWGGKSSAQGFDQTWGSRVDSEPSISGKIYHYKAMDCTGFTSWAIRNACNPDFYNNDNEDYYLDLPGAKEVDINNAKPGDMIEIPGHVQMVIKNNGDGTLIIAEESGSAGLVFNLFDKSHNYRWIVDMSGYYEKTCNKSR